MHDSTIASDGQNPLPDLWFTVVGVLIGAWLEYTDGVSLQSEYCFSMVYSSGNCSSILERYFLFLLVLIGLGPAVLDCLLSFTFISE